MLQRWIKRPISPQAEETQRLDAEIQALFEASKRRSSSPKITHALIDRGWQVGKNRVARRMRVLGLRSIVRRRFKVTTNSQHRFAVAPNRLQRDFTAQRPNSAGYGARVPGILDSFRSHTEKCPPKRVNSS